MTVSTWSGGDRYIGRREKEGKGKGKERKGCCSLWLVLCCSPLVQSRPLRNPLGQHSSGKRFVCMAPVVKGRGREEWEQRSVWQMEWERMGKGGKGKLGWVWLKGEGRVGIGCVGFGWGFKRVSFLHAWFTHQMKRRPRRLSTGSTADRWIALVNSFYESHAVSYMGIPPANGIFVILKLKCSHPFQINVVVGFLSNKLGVL